MVILNQYGVPFNSLGIFGLIPDFLFKFFLAHCAMLLSFILTTQIFFQYLHVQNVSWWLYVHYYTGGSALSLSNWDVGHSEQNWKLHSEIIMETQEQFCNLYGLQMHFFKIKFRNEVTELLNYSWK